MEQSIKLFFPSQLILPRTDAYLNVFSGVYLRFVPLGGERFEKTTASRKRLKEPGSGVQNAP